MAVFFNSLSAIMQRCVGVKIFEAPSTYMFMLSTQS